MNQRIYPSWDQIKQLKNPLTEGEIHLLKFLDYNLPTDPNWTESQKGPTIRTLEDAQGPRRGLEVCELQAALGAESEAWVPRSPSCHAGVVGGG